MPRINSVVFGTLKIWGMVLVLIAVLAVMACNSRVDGCLDPEAENFDVSADRDDRSLCVYPDLKLSVQYAYGDMTFARTRLYQNSFGQTFAVTGLYVLFSQFQLKGEEIGRRTVINDVEWVILPDNVTRVANDFTFVDNLGFNYTLGMWDMSDFVTQLRFTVGVPDTLTPTSPDALASGNKLNDGRAYYNEAQQEYATARFIVVQDSLEAVPDTFHVSSGPISYEYPLMKALHRGGDDTVRVKLDMEVLFGELDLTQDSVTIASELAQRLESAVTDNN